MSKEHTSTLSGTTVTHLDENTNWGKSESEGLESMSAWRKISSAPHVRKGYGYQVTVTLDEDEIESLVSYLDSYCGFMESITAAERAGDTAYRTIRRDCERWANLAGV